MYKSNANHSRHWGMNVHLKPVNIFNDISIIHDWMKTEYILNAIPALPEQETLTELHKSILASNFARSFIVWLNGSTPLFEFIVCEANMDELSSYYNAGPHDYFIRLQLPMQLRPAIAAFGLKACLRYCFISRQANRIMAPVFNANIEIQNLLKKAGFVLYCSLVPLPGHLYVLNRKTFCSRQHLKHNGYTLIYKI